MNNRELDKREDEVVFNFDLSKLSPEKRIEVKAELERLKKVAESMGKQTQ